MCSFGSCQTRFEFLCQFRKVRNAFECFVAQVQTHLPKTKRVWPMKINVICTVRDIYGRNPIVFGPSRDPPFCLSFSRYFLHFKTPGTFFENKNFSGKKLTVCSTSVPSYSSISILLVVEDNNAHMNNSHYVLC